MKTQSLKEKIIWLIEIGLRLKTLGLLFVKKFISSKYSKLGGIYGLGRPNINKDIFKDIIVKKDHYFSRIHVLDISRLIVNILLTQIKIVAGT